MNNKQKVFIKFKKIIFPVICFFFFVQGVLYSQQDSIPKIIFINKDTIEIGKYYSFYLSNKEAFIGRVTSSDDKNILIYAEGNLMIVNKMDIVAIESPRKILYDLSISHEKMGKDRIYWYFGGGYLMTKNDDYKNGFNIHAYSLVTFDNYIGVRTDFDYNHISKNDKTFNSYNNNYYIRTGGTLNSFLFRLNFVTGSLDPENLINIYVAPGIGVGGFYKTSETTTYYPSGGFSNSDPSVLYFTIGVSADAIVDVKITDKIRLYSSYQFNTWSGEIPAYNNLKLGIKLIGR
jgi:hypothetical protein